MRLTDKDGYVLGLNKRWKGTVFAAGVAAVLMGVLVACSGGTDASAYDPTKFNPTVQEYTDFCISQGMVRVDSRYMSQACIPGKYMNNDDLQAMRFKKAKK